MAKRKKRTIIGYKTYMFKAKDPVIDELRTMVQDEHNGTINNKVLTKLHADSGVSVAAQRNWFYGATRRPQNASIEAVGRALGWRREWRRLNGTGKKS